MVLAVIGMQARRPKIARPINLLVQVTDFRTRCQPGSSQTGIDIDEYIDLNTGCNHRVIERLNRFWMICGNGKPYIRVDLTIPNRSRNIWPDGVIGKKHILRTADREHLRLGKCSALVLIDSHPDFQPDNVDHFVGLAMRSQPLVLTGNSLHTHDVFAHDFLEDNQSRRKDLIRRVDCVELFHGDYHKSLDTTVSGIVYRIGHNRPNVTLQFPVPRRARIVRIRDAAVDIDELIAQVRKTGTKMIG